MGQTRHITHGLFPFLPVPIDGQRLFRLIVRLLLAKLSFIVIGIGGTRTEMVIAQLQIDAEPHAAVRDWPAQLRQIKRIFSIFRGNSANADSYLIEILEIYFADL
jgi:hypothetical protein